MRSKSSVAKAERSGIAQTPCLGSQPFAHVSGPVPGECIGLLRGAALPAVQRASRLLAGSVARPLKFPRGLGPRSHFQPQEAGSHHGA